MSENEKPNLTAFADGELDAAESIRALEYLAAHPEVARAVALQQKLRQKVAQAVVTSTPPPPADLRRRIEAMAADDAPIARIGFAARWGPAIAAAILLIASVTVLNVALRRDNAPLLSDAQLASFARRHVGCTTNIEQIHQTIDWDVNLGKLPDVIARHLGAQPAARLDLSELGYEFAGAGPCAIPGTPSAHLIYRATGDRHDALSLWLRSDDGRFTFPEDQPHLVAGPFSPHPVMIWRHAGVIYYLVGDAPEPVREATAHLARLH